MHFSNKQRQCTRRPGWDAKPCSRQPPAAAERMPCLSKHSSRNLDCTNASKPLLASHRENLGPGKEEHILVLARVQGLGQSIPTYGSWRLFGNDVTDLYESHCCAKSSFRANEKSHQLQLGSSLPQRPSVIGESMERPNPYSFLFVTF